MHQLGEKMKNEKLQFPEGISESSRSLIEWLLHLDPEKRPKEFSEVKNHVFFENVHWGKLARREVVPPYIPDLYECNFADEFLRIPVRHAFHPKTILNHKNSRNKESIYVQPKVGNRERSDTGNLFKSMYTPSDKNIDDSI